MARTDLDLSSGVPLYRQIKDILRSEISAGSADPQSPMTELQLLERFDVSRAPIRQALKELADEGWVYRKQGKGTFPVAGVRVDRPADMRPGDLFGYLAERGLHPTSTVSDLGRVEPPSEVARRLSLEPHETLLHFVRLITVDDRPFAQASVYVRAPEDFRPTAAELADGGSVFALLERQVGIVLASSEHEAWATAADAERGRALGVDAGSPLLVIDTVFYARGGVPMGWRSALHHADDFKFHFVTDR